jgi:hypothetical protein
LPIGSRLATWKCNKLGIIGPATFHKRIQLFASFFPRFPATRATDIPALEQFQMTKTQKRDRGERRKVLPFEFRSGVVETTWRLWIKYDFGACLSLASTGSRN